MKHKISFSIWLVLASLTLSAQTEPKNVPTGPRRLYPPTEHLQKLNRFIGNYTLVMESGNQKLPGTMEVKSAINGWYIERTNTTKSDDGKLDVEIRTFITWDSSLGKYRVWRFVPYPQQYDGVAHLEGDTFIEEYEFTAPDGTRAILRNRMSLTTPDEVKIINEIQHADGKVSLRGVVTTKRIVK